MNKPHIHSIKLKRTVSIILINTNETIMMFISLLQFYNIIFYKISDYTIITNNNTDIKRRYLRGSIPLNISNSTVLNSSIESLTKYVSTPLEYADTNLRQSKHKKTVLSEFVSVKLQNADVLSTVLVPDIPYGKSDRSYTSYESVSGQMATDGFIEVESRLGVCLLNGTIVVNYNETQILMEIYPPTTSSVHNIIDYNESQLDIEKIHSIFIIIIFIIINILFILHFTVLLWFCFSFILYLCL